MQTTNGWKIPAAHELDDYTTECEPLKTLGKMMHRANTLAHDLAKECDENTEHLSDVLRTRAVELAKGDDSFLFCWLVEQMADLIEAEEEYGTDESGGVVEEVTP